MGGKRVSRLHSASLKKGAVYPISRARVPEVKKHTSTPEGGGGGLSEFWLTAG